ncbi:MAG TPA: c-type cytochrome [Gammaproteobacteria bacterium]|nr:c-type cytochrome [Gammaproteobacteria bacterium]
MSKWTAMLIAPVGILAGVAAAIPASAAPPPAAATCAACHGENGGGGGGGTFPRLAGQLAAYLARQLHDFKSGARANRIMQPLAAGLSDDQITALAQYYSRAQAPYPSRQKVNPATLAHGESLVRLGKWSAEVPACATCHGPKLAGLAPDFPMLAGQYADYIAGQINAFRRGGRRSDPLNLMQHVARGLDDADVKAVAAYLAWLRPGGDNQVPKVKVASPAARRVAAKGFQPPPESAIPGGPDGEMIRFGEQVFTDTGHYAKAYTGNVLNCSNCHLDRGRLANSAPMWAAFGRYPRYRKKNDKVNTLADRIQGCFVFSMNGKPPPADSKVMVALESYFHWLATGVPVNTDPPGTGYPDVPKPARAPDPARGAQVFKTHCALCHGADGQGRTSAGAVVFPPLWGPQSFNWGAGMHRIPTAAAFIKANMPLGLGGTLTDQQAWDVAAFVDHHPRPQDPRFTGSVKETKQKYHQHMGYYGQVPSTPTKKEITPP